MEPNFSQGAIKINREIFNQTIEQPIELEYQLPDYLTGIFKMLQFRAEPHICSFRSSGEQFTIDGNTIIKLIYIDEEEGNIKSIHQNIPFSKTLKLKTQANDPCIFYNIKTNYANCKIVSSKKIEIKGSANIFLKIYDKVEEPILQNLSIEETKKTGIHLKKQPLKLISDQLWNNQPFKISEQIEFETPIEQILDIKIKIVEDEHKTILNKIISKATAYLTIIYCSTDKKTALNKKLTTVVNQILEMPKVDEKFLCNIDYDITSFSSKILQEGNVLKVDAECLINGYAYKSSSTNLICDVFSTKYEIKTQNKSIETFDVTETIKENFNLNETFTALNFNKIVDVNAQFSNIETEKINNQIKVNAKLTVNAYGITNDDTPEIFEKSIPISFTVKQKIKTKSERIDLKLNIFELNFTIDDNKNLNLTINFQVNGLINCLNKIELINKIELDEKQPKPKSNATLTLFYPQANDNIWNIAKQFSTCPKEIMEANNLKNEKIENETMLIIPIV